MIHQGHEATGRKNSSLLSWDFVSLVVEDFQTQARFAAHLDKIESPVPR
jgi:hypothetical protein